TRWPRDWSSDVCSSDLIDPSQLARELSQQKGGLLDIFNVLAGGAVQRMAIFALGIMPYISASIIMQLMTTVFPELEALKKEGERSEERRVGKESRSRRS